MRTPCRETEEARRSRGEREEHGFVLLRALEPYLLQRRVERARALPGDTRRPLVDIALSVGFGTQPHFTTVFKRFAGETPNRWRRSLDAGAAAM